MFAETQDKFAFIKPSLDAHTLGIVTASELIRDCGYDVIIADDRISHALNDIKYEANQNIMLDWILEHKITFVGLSYRLDKDEAINIFGFFMNLLKRNNLLYYQGGQIKAVFFGGLPSTCEAIEKEYKGLVKTYKGGESVFETLRGMLIPKERIPNYIIKSSLYDEGLLEFGNSIISSGEYVNFKPARRKLYKEFMTSEDTVVKRIENNMSDNFIPLLRAHVGPYSSSADRIDSVNEFISWVKYLNETKYLDILSIGSSQLTQSNFAEDWGDRPNGGGVPINSPDEYRMIKDAAGSMFLRTYSGTKNILSLSKMHEQTLNICWHALSLWWFNKLDNRGPYDLYTNLKQHFETIKYIAKTNKPLEANVSHHFSFRGADDVTYIVSAYLAAFVAKKLGIKTFILQNMLNTPRLTWGVQDLAKSRALLKIVKTLEDDRFKILLQPRAGLDYFKPDLDEAKIQLSAVSALMDDIDPNNEASPPLIHVVSYCEACHLATPDIINESIKITLHSIEKYRGLRRKGNIEDMSKNLEVIERMELLLSQAQIIIDGINKYFSDPYTPEGFYKIFTSGMLPVPFLWNDDDEYKFAKHFKTKPVKGGMRIVDESNNIVNSSNVVEFAVKNIDEVSYNLKHKYKSV